MLFKKKFDLFKSELLEYYDSNEALAISNLVFEWVLKTKITLLLVEANKPIRSENILQLDAIISRLKLYEPLQYVLEEAHFFGLNLKVNKHTLIPRPETEELVDLILKNHQEASLKILDIGTGSGCIAVALKKFSPHWEVQGLDVSEKAIEVAAFNANRHQVKVDFHVDSILNPSLQWPTFDLMVSNPPYITPKEKEMMHNNVLLHEPALALFVEEENPIVFYTKIIDFAKTHLNKKGSIYVEINPLFAQEISAYAYAQGFRNVDFFLDFQGKKRVIRISNN